MNQYPAVTRLINSTATNQPNQTQKKKNQPDHEQSLTAPQTVLSFTVSKRNTK